MKKFLILIAALLITSGCHPYSFWMGGPHAVSCEILTPLHSVDHAIDSATLHDTAAIDMNYFGATQYQITMGVQLKAGNGFRILLRPVVEHRDVRDSGIILTATTSGISIDSGRIVALTRPDVMIAKDKIIHVSLLSQNNYMQVVLDCDTVFRGWTKRNESDDIVVQALPASEVEVIQPDWAGIPGE